MRTVRIGEAAAAAGMTTKALRFYEQHGLLPPVHRGPNGYRDYPPEALARLRAMASRASEARAVAAVAPSAVASVRKLRRSRRPSRAAAASR